MGMIGDPAGCGKGIASKTIRFTRACEAPPGSWQMKSSLDNVLYWPECCTGKKHRAEVHGLPSTNDISPAQAFCSCEEVRADRDRDHEAQNNMPIEQIEAHQHELSACNPPEASHEG